MGADHKKTNNLCIKGESNPRRVDGNDPGYHYPINACYVLTKDTIMTYLLHLAPIHNGFYGFMV